MTTNEADRTDEHRPADEAIAPDESVDEHEADDIDERDESQPTPDAEPATQERAETGQVGIAPDDMAGDGDRSDTGPRSDASGVGGVGGAGDVDDVASGVDGPLLADGTAYRERWYEIQTGFVDEPRHAVQTAGELLREMMEDLTRRLTTELSAFDAGPGAGGDVSTEDLRVTFQRYRSFFDRLLAA